MFLWRPLRPYLGVGVLFLPRQILFALPLPVFLALGIDIFGRIGEVNFVIRVAPRRQQHFKCFAFGIAVLAIARENVVFGNDALEEVAVKIVGAAVMRDLQQIDAQLARIPGIEESNELQTGKHLVAAGIARQQHALSAGLYHHNDA